MEPQILCLDEPLSNLDAKLRVGLREELKRLQKDLNITTLYVTHDQEEALTLSDRIAVFNNGFIEQVGTPYEIYNKSASEFVCDFIGDINRLGSSILKEVNAQTNSKLKEDVTGFMRIEMIHLNPREHLAKLNANVRDFEYNGVFTKYVIEVLGEEIKIIIKNDGRGIYEIGQNIDIYINPDDIMQF